MESFARRLNRYLPDVLIALLVLSLVASAANIARWQSARDLNTAFSSLALLTQPVKPTEHLRAYSVGYLYAINGKFRDAARAFTLAEAADDPDLRARAKFALGNLYFDIGLKAADIESGGSHINGLAQIELAREAYKSALRIDSDLRDARYNLELLDRLSPPKRVEGWERETDGVTLVPQKRDGWASMKDNKRRGLP